MDIDMSVLPKEHGAYGQMAIPVVTSFAVAGVSAPVLLIALGVIGAFLAHEPLLLILGRRGARAKHEQSHRAALWLAFTGLMALAAGVSAWWLVPPDVRCLFLLPLLPTMFLIAAIVAKREKTSLGEVAVALTFSSAAVPLSAAAGAPSSVAVALGIVFAAIFVTGTLAVRVVILSVRAGGNVPAAAATRGAVLVLATATVVGLVTAALARLLPWTPLFAAVPGVGAAALFSLFPPSTARLRCVGWTLVTTSAAASVILVLGLTGAL